MKNKTKKITITVSPTDIEIIKKLAEENHLSVSAFIRNACFNYKKIK